MKKLLIFPALMMLTAGCGNKMETSEFKNAPRTVTIDTLTIHGNPHEVIFGSGIMHSPECWCGKEVMR